MTTLNVTDFGATPQPTTVTDQGGPINAALAQARQLADPALTTVYVPAGIYPITSTLLIGSYTRLLLDPAAVIRMDTSATANMLRSWNGPSGVGGQAVTLYNGEHDIVVEGGTWDGNEPALTNGATMLQFGHCRNITVRNARLVRSQENHFIEYNAVQGGLIEDCYFEKMIEQTEAVQIDLAIDSGAFPWYGAYDKTPCDDVTVQRCTFGPGIGRCVGSHNSASGKWHTRIRVLDCVLTEPSMAAVWPLNWGGGCEVDLRGVNTGKWDQWEFVGTAPKGRFRASFEIIP